MTLRMGWGVLVVGIGFVSLGPVWAEPKGKGHGQAQSTEAHAKKAAGRVANEAIDAVADEVVGTPPGGTSKGMPPGLAKKGTMPPGLERQGKTPPGWEKGRKEGWNKEPANESLLRRMVRGIFGGKKPAEQQPATP